MEPINKDYATLPKTNMRTISVVLRRGDTNEPKPLRCMTCGKMLCGVVGELTLIFEGKVIEVNEATDIPCVRCSIIYRVIY